MSKNKTKKEVKKQREKTISSIRPFKEILLDIVRKKKEREDPVKQAEIREKFRQMKPKKVEPKKAEKEDTQDGS